MNIKRRTVINLIFLMFCIIACQHGNVKTNSKGSLKKKTSKHGFNINDIDSVEQLISILETGKNVCLGGEGFTGNDCYLYGCYEQLLKVASDSVWLNLSYNQNVVVRFYAFRALLTKKYSDIKSVRERLMKDSTLVSVISYDTHTPSSLSDWVSHMK